MPALCFSNQCSQTKRNTTAARPAATPGRTCLALAYPAAILRRDGFKRLEAIIKLFQSDNRPETKGLVKQHWNGQVSILVDPAPVGRQHACLAAHARQSHWTGRQRALPGADWTGVEDAWPAGLGWLGQQGWGRWHGLRARAGRGR